jgi:hypothetical protein
MRGNSHVRFLGEGAAATPLSYPTLCGVKMSRKQFTEAVGRVRRCLILALFLTGGAAIALAFGLPAWGSAREWLHALPHEGAAGLVMTVVMGVVVPVSFFLVPLLVLLWADRRFGLECPGCQRSVTLGSRAGRVLRLGRCCLCQRALFEPGETETADPDAPAERPRD